MVTEIKNSLYYFSRYTVKTVLTFWGIYIGFITLFFVLSVTTDGTIEFTGVNTLPATIFMVIFGIMFFKDVFPYNIKLGISRTPFSIAVLIFSVMLTTVMTGIAQLFLVFVNWITEKFNIDNFAFVGLNTQIANFTDHNTLIYEYLVNLTLFLLALLIAVILFRLGFKYGMLVLIILPLSLFIRSVAYTFVNWLSYLAIFHNNYHPGFFLIPIIGFSLLFWFVVRNASVVDQISHKG